MDQIQPTKALRKISALKKRIWAIQGGQGAGKTIAILLIIINHGRSTKDKFIVITSAELTKMRVTVIKDFVDLMRILGFYQPSRFINGTTYRFESGSVIKFIGLDKEDVGKGLRSDIVFVNEANKVPFDTYRELTSRAKRIILDYNPNNRFWAHDEVIPRDDCSYLQLTYEDNEYLSTEEKSEILRYKQRAYKDPDLPDYDKPDNILSEYWRNKWHVYGLGIVGTSPNRIFYFHEISDEKYQAIDVKKYYGVDWGTVDPWGIIEVKYYDGALYVHELNYSSENEIRGKLLPDQHQAMKDDDDGLVTWLFNILNIPKKNYVICDNNRPMKVAALQNAGWDNAIAAIKGQGSVNDGIDLLNEVDVYFTTSSKNFRMEQENYEWEVDRYGLKIGDPVDANNHLIDPLRYVATFLQIEGVITKF